MAEYVIIEGSRISPTTELAAGVRRRVALTPRVQKLLDAGYVVEISRGGAPDAPPAKKTSRPRAKAKKTEDADGGSAVEGEVRGDQDLDDGPGGAGRPDHPEGARESDESDRPAGEGESAV